MVNTNKLKGRIAELGMTQKQVYETMGLTKKQWDDRMSKAKLNSDDMYSLIHILSIENPMPIFFANEVT